MMDASGSSSASQNGTPSLCTPTHAFKRKRRSELSFSPPSDFETIANAKGDVEIVEVDPGGKFIRLNNKGNKVGITLIIGQLLYCFWIIEFVPSFFSRF